MIFGKREDGKRREKTGKEKKLIIHNSKPIIPPKNKADQVLKIHILVH